MLIQLSSGVYCDLHFSSHCTKTMVYETRGWLFYMQMHDKNDVNRAFTQNF